MLELLELISQKPVVVTLALIGATIVTLAGWAERRERLSAAGAGVLTKAGYTITGLSVLLFIVAGFIA